MDHCDGFRAGHTQADEPVEPVKIGLSPNDPDYDEWAEAAAERAEREAAEMEYLSSLAQFGPGAIEEYFEGKRYEAANQAAAEPARPGCERHTIISPAA